MLTIKTHQVPGYEKVIEAEDKAVNLHAFIAIHSTKMGPSLGGTRIYPYASSELALNDALRLSKAMSLKSALAKTGLGGGKSVIIGDPKHDKTEALLLAFGEVVNTLNGDYIAAEDVGTTPEDLLIIHRKTPYVAALPIPTSSGDPSRFTAYGVLLGMRAVTKEIFGTTSLEGIKVAIQGLGSVGSKLAHFLFWEGAELVLTDVDSEKLLHESTLLGAKTVAPEKIFEFPCDIFAPCALGGVLNQKTIPLLNCKAVAGSANNQLENTKDSYLLKERGILHAPGIAINSGGIINASCEFDPGGYNPTRAREKTHEIYRTLESIFQLAKKENKPTHVVAEELAEYNMQHLFGKRTTKICLT